LEAARFATVRGTAIADMRGAETPLRAVGFFAPATGVGRPVFWATRDALTAERRLREGLVDFAITMSHAVFIPDKARAAWPRNPAFRQGDDQWKRTPRPMMPTRIK
jgi:hypothetical protein